MSKRMLWVALLSLLVVGTMLGAAGAQEKRVLNIYSARHYGATEQPFVNFEAATGIEIRLSQGSPRDLLERLRAEGNRTPADLFLSIDAGALSLAAEEGLLQPIESDVLEANLPAEMRDPEGRWFALSLRARTLVYNTENVSEEELASINTYSDLADPQWAGRICFRPASHIYTLSLFSSLVYHLGEDGAKEVMQGIVANNPKYIDSDQRQIQAISAGECDMAFVNQYYLANFIAREDPVTQNVGLKWMNQDDSGVFFNANGAGVTANAENYAEAVEFIEYFSALDGQDGTIDGLPGVNNEFPANPEAEPSTVLQGFGEVKFDLEFPLWAYGEYQALTITLLEEVGFGFQEN